MSVAVVYQQYNLYICIKGKFRCEDRTVQRRKHQLLEDALV